MIKAFNHIIHPELIIPSRRHKHITYKKNDRQVSIDTTKNQVHVYEKDDNDNDNDNILNKTIRENMNTN